MSVDDQLDPLDRLGDAFRGLMASVRRLKGRETHRPGALSHAQYSLMFVLAREGQLSARDLACTADLSAATVTQMLDGLAAAGLVERHRSETDRRIVLTSLTKRGEELTATKRADYELRWRATLKEFSDDELATATAVLERLKALFDQFGEAPAEVPEPATPAAV